MLWKSHAARMAGTSSHELQRAEPGPGARVQAAPLSMLSVRSCPGGRAASNRGCEDLGDQLSRRARRGGVPVAQHCLGRCAVCQTLGWPMRAISLKVRAWGKIR
jgi:hypothetical protein